MLHIKWLVLIFTFILSETGVKKITASSNGTLTISCHSRLDYFLLLYKICQAEDICREIYKVGPAINTSLSLRQYTKMNASTINSNNRGFIHFSRRIAQLNILSLLAKVWPASRQPNVTIETNSNQTFLCSNSFDESSLQGQNFVIASSYALQTYHSFVSTEFHCGDINEVVVFGSNGTFRCVCRDGANCNNDANFNTLFIVLQSFLMLLILIWIIVTLVDIYYNI